MRWKHIIVSLLLLLLFVAPAAAQKPTATRVSPREQAEALLPRTIIADGMLVPVVHAAAAVVYDPDSEDVLYETNGHDVRSIASITKLMTAAVVLEDNPDLTTMVTVAPVDVKLASHTYLRAGDRLTVDQLLHLMLVASDNVAARVLARASDYGSAGFVDRMNAKALELGLEDTHYADPAGLLAANLSTGFDMAKMIALAAADAYTSSAMHLLRYTVRLTHRVVVASTTDHLLAHPTITLLAAKTGYIHEAGFCLASLLQLPDGEKVAIVVFGTDSNDARFIEVENLYHWLTARSNASLHVSEDGLAFLKAKEGFHNQPYFDHQGWAIGYGAHYWNGLVVTRRTPAITQDEADRALPDQLVKFENIVKQTVVFPLTQNAFDALVSVAYNLGRVNTQIIQRLSAGQPVSAKDFLATATVHNHLYAPLVSRRLGEFDLFSDGR